MIITRIMGGLGNQLFTYSAGRALAIRNGVPLKLDLSDYADGGDKRADGLQAFSRKYLLSGFNIAGTPATQNEIDSLRDPYYRATFRDRAVRQVRKVVPGFLRRKSHIREYQYRFEPEIVSLSSPVYLTGFWQSYKYFEKCAEEIRRDLTFKDPAIMQKAKSILAPLRADGSSVVAVHIRRGDLAKAQELGKINIVHGSPVGLEYIYAAMKKFDANSKFLVFSDTSKDIQWCRENIKWNNLYFCEGNTDLEDFATMQCCDHNIMANSTFSWWAAWLNANPGKKIVTPARWAPPGGPMQMVTDDLLLPEWETIG